MAITHFIAHRLFRPSPSSATAIELRSSELPIDGKLEELCRELKTTFVKKTGKTYGQFSDNAGEHPLAAWLNAFLSEKIGFTRLCEDGMKHLKLQIEQTESPIDNTVIFFSEQLEAGDAFYVFVVDHSSGQYFDGDLALCDARYLDTQHVNLAAKINVQDFLQQSSTNYLTVLRWRGEKELSDAFTEFAGLSNKVDITEETTQFLELVTHYTQDLPDEIAKEARTTVVDFCLEQDKSGKPVVFEDLSAKISQENKPAFATFVKTAQPQSKPELIPDTTQLRNYVRISGRNDQLSMSFASACLGESVVYDADSDSITIKNIPSSLKARLMKHLQKGGNQ